MLSIKCKILEENMPGIMHGFVSEKQIETQTTHSERKFVWISQNKNNKEVIFYSNLILRLMRRKISNKPCTKQNQIFKQDECFPSFPANVLHIDIHSI